MYHLFSLQDDGTESVWTTERSPSGRRIVTVVQEKLNLVLYKPGTKTQPCAVPTWRRKACLNPAEFRGHLPVLQWARQHGCSWDEEYNFFLCST